MKPHLLFYMIIFNLFIMLFNYHEVQAATNNQPKIETTPLQDSFLFDLTNMKPGDWAKRNLTIRNPGKSDFTYTTQATFDGGDKKLYDEFLLEVRDANGIVHTGKLKDFSGLASRGLKSMNEEDLLFTLTFPPELNNEFQGLGFQVEFKFIAEVRNTPTNNPPSDPPNNPEVPGDPENPPNPNDPIIPEDPINPNDPSNTNLTTPNDPDNINPQQPIDPETLHSPPSEGQILPSTATNIFNIIFAGILFLIGGLLLLFLSREKAITFKKFTRP